MTPKSPSRRRVFVSKIIAAATLLLVIPAAAAQTLFLNDSSITVPNPLRGGMNLGSFTSYDSGLMFKNLIRSDNWNFEPNQLHQIFALTATGTTTSFSNANAYATFPVNSFAGATFTVVDTQSGGPELSCSGTIASNTTGNGSNVAAVYTLNPITSQGSSGCLAAFSPGDIVLIYQNQAPTPESCWESSGNCGIFGSVSGGGKLTTDSITPWDGQQSLVLDVTAGSNAAADARFYFDNNTNDIFALINGTYTVTGYVRQFSGAPTPLQVQVTTPTGICIGTVAAPSSTWSPFSTTCTFTATSATTPENHWVDFEAAGSGGAGAVEIDDVGFQKINAQDSTNPTVFRDETVAALRAVCATSTPGPPCLIRNWSNQNGETTANWTLPPGQTAWTTAGSGWTSLGESTPQLQEYLNLVQLVGALPYFTFPCTSTVTDATNFIDYMSSTNTSSGFGQVRAAQGQSAPWVGPGGVFPTAWVSFCNEAWNSSSFIGQGLPFRSSAGAQYYYDYANRTKDIYAAMRADSNFSTNMKLGFDLQSINNAPQSVPASFQAMAAVGGAPDFAEIAPYTQDTVSNWQTDSALWSSAMEEPWGNVHDPSSSSSFYQNVQLIQGINLCGPSGNAACAVSVYEEAAGSQGTCNVAGNLACSAPNYVQIDQNHLDFMTAGAGQGVIAPLQMLLNQQQLGVSAQNYFGLTGYENGTLNGSLAKFVKLWGCTVDMGGSTSYLNQSSYTFRPACLGLQIANQSIIGPEFFASFISGLPTYNWAGDPYNGPTDALANVPYIYPFCFEAQSSGYARSCVFINTSLTSPYTITFDPSGAPNGSCVVRQFAPSSIDALNEGHSGKSINTTPASTSISTNAATCSSSLILPVNSVTALDFTASGLSAASAPAYSVAPGTYTTGQSVVITDATPGASIYYTTDGSTPSTASLVYSSPIAVTSTQTISAVAIASGYSISPVAAASYTIVLPAPPYFSPASGTYSSPQVIAISDTSSNVSLYYTTDRSTPTASSTLYTAPVAVSASGTLKAIAIASGNLNSAVGTAAYTINSTPPTINYSTGFTSAGINLYGATLSGNTLKLTDGGTAESHVAWFTKTVNIQAFTTDFTFQNTAATSNGFTFAIQNAPAGVYAVGGNGNALGYSAAVTPSVAVKFDLHTPVGLGTNSTGFYTNGASPITPALDMTPSGVNLHNSDILNAHITYDGATLTLVLTDTVTNASFTASTSINIPNIVGKNTAYVGFTGSTGAQTAIQTILTWTYTVATAMPSFSPVAGSYVGAQTVTLSDSAAGATINYTTDGSTPTSASPVYSSPISVTSSETINAIAFSNGMSSAVATAPYVITYPAATPAFSIQPGVFANPQTVAISDATAGAAVYYTTNGTTPTAASTLYTSPITVSASETINAIAIATGLANSAIASATYTINGAVATPVMSPPGGVYGPPTTVTITDSTPGATIYYTTNGTVPSTASTRYSGSISVSASETLNAIAVATNYNNSPIASATYTINGLAATPVIAPSAGSYATAQSVTITDATPGAAIYYTTNGSAPTANSTLYSGPIAVSASETLNAVAIATNYVNSAVATASYIINGSAATPAFSPVSGSFANAQSVTITDATSGAAIYYTTNGSAPTANSTLYSGPIAVATSETLSAIAIATNYANSAIATASYIINGSAATPAFSPVSGSFANAQSVTITDATSGAAIYYTTNGSAPTANSTLYSGPIAVATSESLSAIAIATNYANSAIATASYTINGSAATPAFSPASGAYTSIQTVTLTDATPGAIIYYTTDGSTPTTASAVYSAPVTVNATETINAIAAASAYSPSAVGTATYSISVSSAPTFSPVSATYAAGQTVTISEAAPGAAIYYTTDGSTPTIASSVYSVPLTVSATETLNAIAFLNGVSTAIGTANYTITSTPPLVDYSSGFTASGLSLSGAAIASNALELTDGGLGETNATWLTAPVNVQAFTTDFTFQNTAATANGFTFAIQNASAGNAAIGGSGSSLGYGGIGNSVAVKFDLFNSAGEGSDSTGFYSNGATPTVPSLDLTASGVNLHSPDILQAHLTYDGATLTLTLTDTVTDASFTAATAIDIPGTVGGASAYIGFTASTGTQSAVQNILTWTYLPATIAPTFSPAAGSYNSAQTVAINDATGGALIYYSTDGSTPTAASAQYSAPISVATSETLNAIAIAPNFAASTVATAAYTINGPAATPTFSPIPGSYASTQTVAIADSTTGAAIYYTINGATPTAASTPYTAPISVAASETISAIAIAPNFAASTVATAAYTINGPAATPTFSPAPGPYASTQTVTIADSTTGAAIYYTINGTTPTAASSPYTAPISVAATETINAIAIAPNFAASTVATAAYTINGPAATPTFSPIPGSYASTQTVAIADTTTGAAIYYTTNGTTPTAASTPYTAPISVAASETINAIAIAPNFAASTVATAAYTINGPTATPTFSPAPGQYASTQTVAIADSTTGAAIYYTINGTTPTAASTPYTAPISVAASETISAIAIAPNFAASTIATAAYTINGPTATPTFSPIPGSYASTQTVAIADSTTGAAIYYTINGATPTAASTPYTAPISVAASETISAIAIAPNFAASTVATAAYTINGPTATPTFSPAPGPYASTQTVAIADSTTGAAIYFTINGTTPTAASTPYTAPISVAATETINAIAIAPNFAASTVATGAYTINGPTATPTFSPAPGPYASTQTVAIADSTTGAAIYYTINGTTPTAASTPYTAPISVAASETLNAIAIAPNFSASTVATAAYTINGPTATPTFSPIPGPYASTQTVAIADATPGAAIYYTINGTTPTAASSPYTAPISVAATETINAIAIAPNFAASAVASAAYTINGPTATPTFSPAPGQYASTQTVAIADSTTGAAIYFTTNGTTPTAASTPYTAPISVAASETINAIAIAPNFAASTVATAAYTINGPTPTPTFSPTPGPYASTQTVAIADSTTGAAIYYTINGATPTAASTPYTAPISVAASETINAIAIAPNFAASTVATGAYTINGPAATPTFSPAPGPYASTQTVAIADSTTGAAIYYTINGTTPTAASTPYTTPISVATSETINAIAIAPNFSASTVATASYTINGPTATPTFSPTPGPYASTQTVAIADSTTGAAIYYTINGTTPTAASTPYTAPISVSASETINAIAIAPNFAASTVATGAYTINGPAATPTFSPAPGPYASTQPVAIADSTTGAAIYYTINGTTPTAASTPYTAPIAVATSQTINAIAIAPNFAASTVATAAYTINGPTAIPTFSPAPGSYASAQTVAIADATTGAAIYYTINGTTPTAASTPYTAPIFVTASETINAIAIAPNFAASTVATAAYTINGPTATPTFSPAPGPYASTQTVTIADATPGAAIYYTINGTTPTAASTPYTAPISVAATETINAIAIAPNFAASTVATAAYTINGPTAAPTFSPAPGPYASAQTVTIADATPGAAIHYTINGTTPTASSTPYTTPIAVSASETINAIAIKANFANSAIASAAYTISLPTAATPTFSPATGTYANAQSVTIADTTAGAVIYYTVNGTTPTTASTKYTGKAIAVSTNQTLNAVATATGYTNSLVGTATYTLQAATPAISLAAGTYVGAQSVTLTDATTTAAIYYTLNGTTPTSASTKYAGKAIAISATETLEAIAIATGYANSSVATAAYTLQVATPTFTPVAGTYAGTQTVTIADATAGAIIYYTTDGTVPTAASNKYAAPGITAKSTSTLQAFATATGYANSPVASAVYTITAALPIVNFATGFTATGLNLYGAAIANNALEITDGGTGESHVAWFKTPVNVQAFTTDFTFKNTAATANGFTIALQNSSSGIWAVGNNGSGLGYSGIKPSVAIKFDLNNSAGEGTDSTGFFLNGATPTTPAIDMTASGVNLHSADILHAHITYDGTTLTLTLTDTVTNAAFTTSKAVNIPTTVGANTAYVGFTGSTGAGTAIQNILTWTYTVN